MIMTKIIVENQEIHTSIYSYVYFSDKSVLETKISLW